MSNKNPPPRVADSRGGAGRRLPHCLSGAANGPIHLDRERIRGNCLVILGLRQAAAWWGRRKRAGHTARSRSGLGQRARWYSFGNPLSLVIPFGRTERYDRCIPTLPFRPFPILPTDACPSEPGRSPFPDGTSNRLLRRLRPTRRPKLRHQPPRQEYPLGTRQVQRPRAFRGRRST